MYKEIFIRFAEGSGLSMIVKFNQAWAHETEKKELLPEVASQGVEELGHNSNPCLYVVAADSSTDQTMGTESKVSVR